MPSRTVELSGTLPSKGAAAPTGEVTTTVRTARLHGDGPIAAQVTGTLTPGSKDSVARLRLPRLPVGIYVVDTAYAGSPTVQASSDRRVLVVLP